MSQDIKNESKTTRLFQTMYPLNRIAYTIELAKVSPSGLTSSVEFGNPCQAEEELLLVFEDLLTVQNIRYATICFCMASAYLDRKAQVRQSECSSSEKLQWIETSMRLFHFEMAILGQIFKNFYGDRMDRWSLTRCMDELG